MLRLHPSTLVAAVLFVALAAAVAGVHGGEMPGYDWIKMSIMSGMWGMDPEDDQYPQRVSPPAPPVPAYMGSLDYGGQPPSYKMSAIKQASSWPVDRSEGAPAPLRLQRPSPTPASESSSSASASAQRKEEQASSPPSAGGSGFFRNLLNWGGRAVKAVGTAVSGAALRVSQGVRGLPLFGRGRPGRTARQPAAALDHTALRARPPGARALLSGTDSVGPTSSHKRLVPTPPSHRHIDVTRAAVTTNFAPTSAVSHHGAATGPHQDAVRADRRPRRGEEAGRGRRGAGRAGRAADGAAAAPLPQQAARLAAGDRREGGARAALAAGGGQRVAGRAGGTLPVLPQGRLRRAGRAPAADLHSRLKVATRAAVLCG